VWVVACCGRRRAPCRGGLGSGALKRWEQWSRSESTARPLPPANHTPVEIVRWGDGSHHSCRYPAVGSPQRAVALDIGHEPCSCPLSRLQGRAGRRLAPPSDQAATEVAGAPGGRISPGRLWLAAPRLTWCGRSSTLPRDRSRSDSAARWMGGFGG